MKENLNPIVMKFGGSSQADAYSCKNVIEIIKNSKPIAVIVSAPGKTNPDDVKATNLLENIYEKKKAGVAYDYELKILIKKFDSIIGKKHLSGRKSLAKDLYHNIGHASTRDQILSMGEFFQAYTIAELLDYAGYNAKVIDPMHTIFFDNFGEIDEQKTFKALRKEFSEAECTIVFPGFYGNMNGNVKVMSRGGSDLTGAIVASALKVEVYENWTDVDGFFSADPNRVKGARSLSQMTYEEASILSYAGSSVLHEDTMTFLCDHNIPLHIRNTKNPNAPGTLILPCMENRNKGLVGIVGQSGFTIINISKIGAHKMTGFGAGILDSFVKFGISYSYELPSGRDNSKFAIKSELLNKVDIDLLQERLKKVVNPKNISIIEEVGVINAIAYNPTDFTDILLVLERNVIPVRTKSHDDDTGQVIITLPEGYVDQAVQVIHDRFFH